MVSFGIIELNCSNMFRGSSQQRQMELPLFIIKGIRFLQEHFLLVPSDLGRGNFQRFFFREFTVTQHVERSVLGYINFDIYNLGLI